MLLMEIGELRFFKSQAEFRKWLGKNHEKKRELWLGFYKKVSSKNGITYAQALDEALCYGWIDGIRKSIDEESYTNRFTPRRKCSRWSKINTGHIKRLTKAGLMMPSGLKEVSLAKKDGRWNSAYSSSGR